jgi:hypothetical protein
MKRGMERRYLMPVLYDILKLVMVSNGDQAIPDPFTLVLTLVLGVFTAFMSVLFMLVGALANLSEEKRAKVWTTLKLVFYPVLASVAFGAALLLRRAYEIRYLAYLLLAPGIGIIVWGIGDRYSSYISKSFLASYLVGGPMTILMLSIYLAGRDGKPSPLIGHGASIILGILFFDLFLCGIIGMILSCRQRTR